jgi:hypothetical protein
LQHKLPYRSNSAHADITIAIILPLRRAPFIVVVTHQMPFLINSGHHSKG